MDSDGLPIVGPAIDLTKVGSIQQKRTVAFLNHFITHTVNFLNRFSCVCEEKLSDLSNRLQRVDVTMSILEAKLASIPGLENVTAAETAPASSTSNEPTPAAVTTSSPSETTAPENEEAAPPVEEEPAEPVMTVSKDPRYAKYFHMMKVMTSEAPNLHVSKNLNISETKQDIEKLRTRLRLGVPLAALRPKVIADGLDPALLETPDAPVPGGGQVSQNSDDDDEMSSASSFSDDDD